MRRFFASKLAFAAVFILFGTAFTWNLVHGTALVPVGERLIQPDPACLASGPTVPPAPWETFQIASGPTVPPAPWETFQIASGPTVPPAPWETFQIASGPTVPPAPWETLRPRA